MRSALITLSDSGLSLARRLRAAWGERAAIFGPACVVGACGGPGDEAPPPPPGLPSGAFATAEPGVFGWRGPLREFMPGVWEGSDAIVAVMALGIVVRLIGPLARDKRRDPAVVVVDDAGRFAVSVLGGHGAGANTLAREVAALLGAQPVVTTASEAQELPAVDAIGRDFGWTIERAENLTRVAAAVVRRHTVAVWQDAGSPDWWRPFGPWPEHFVRLRTWDDLEGLEPAAVLAISDRALPDRLPSDRTVIYRPPTLIAGVGCRRGALREALDAWIAGVFARFGLAEASLAALATVTLKADEPGLIACAAGRGVPLHAFPPAQLTDIPGIETPSERVRAKIGIPSVSEAAALRAAGASRLLVPKQIGPGMTLAVARRDQSPTRPEARETPLHRQTHQTQNDGGPMPGA